VEHVRLITAGLIGAVVLAGCGGGGGAGGGGGGGGNTAPVINSLSAAPESIWPSGTTSVTCSASDANGDSLSYSWSADAGTVSGSSSTATWNAPATGGAYQVSCQVSDGRGGSVSGSVDITAGATVEGQVVDLQGNPVAGVQVTVDGIAGTTGADGKFTIVGVSQGTHEVMVPGGDYVIAGGAVTVQATSPGQVVSVPNPVPVIDIGGGPPAPPF
jgi:hypothetical protein